MSGGRNSPPLPSPNATHGRRASVTSQTFQDLFGRQNSTQPHPGPITTAAVNAQRRRLSLTTLGLSVSPNQPSFPVGRPRTESLSSANSGSVDESPFEDDPSSSASASNPATPFARRLSFGARALRDVRQGNGSIGNSNGRSSIHHKASSPPTARGRGLSSSASPFTFPLPIVVSPVSSLALSSASQKSLSTPSSVLPHLLADHFKQHPNHALGEHELTSLLSNTGEGYNFAENLRSRAERSSISGAHPMLAQSQQQQHHRAKSVTVMEPPVREMPKQARVPDAMQERILKGDFYMD